MNTAAKSVRSYRSLTSRTVYPILLMVSITHLLNDMMQSVIPAVYPLLKEKFDFTFAQIGLITLVFQLTSSLLQPVAGLLADRHPRPYSLAGGMCFTLAGLLVLAFAPGFVWILIAVGLIGCGSSVFHPESSRVAQLASGGRKGLAQSIFQVGGNAGSAMGPLLAALIVIPFGQSSIGWFALTALLAIFILVRIGDWYKRRLAIAVRRPDAAETAFAHSLPRRKIHTALVILGILVFSKYFYIASMTSYFTFFLMDKFAVSVQGAQYCLFAFLAASAAGTFIGGPLGDRIGRKYVIWGSILGAAPFYPAATLRRFGCDRRAVRSDRAGHFVGLFRHSGLCHRSDARQGGDDRRSLFRPDVRAGRSRFGVFRLAGGPDEYRVYFSGQHAVAPVGCYHRFFAEYRVEKRKIGFSVHVLLLLFGAGRG